MMTTEITTQTKQHFVLQREPDNASNLSAQTPIFGHSEYHL